MRHRLVVVPCGVLVVALFSCLAHSQPASAPERSRVASSRPPVEREHAGTAKGKDAPSFPLPLPVRIVEDEANAQHARDREQKSDRHEAEDLQAQRDSARAGMRAASAAMGQEEAAWSQVYLTGFGTLVAIIGTGFLVMTYQQTKITAKAADASAKAAQDMVIDSRNSYIIQHRPWVSIELLVDGPVTWRGESVILPFKYILRNHGLTPALRTQVFILLSSDPLAFFYPEENEFLKQNKNLPFDRGYMIFPNIPVEDMVECQFNQAEIEAHAQTIQPGVRSFNVTIACCVIYQFAFTPGNHQTVRTYHLYRAISEYPGRAMFRINVGVPANQLILEDAFGLKSYAD